MIRQRKDGNERGIVLALRAAGCYVQQMDRSAGFDLLVMRGGETWAIEVKQPGETYTENEIKTCTAIQAHGGQYHTARSIDDALRIVGSA